MPSWDDCAFQSTERQDQLIFTLLGGVVAHLGARCRVWDPPVGRCGCSASEALMGLEVEASQLGS